MGQGYYDVIDRRPITSSNPVIKHDADGTAERLDLTVGPGRAGRRLTEDNPMDLAQRLVASFSRSIGIDDLALDETGGCTLAFDDVGVRLVHLPEAEQLLIYSPVGNLGPEGREATLTALLAANLFFRGTQGATLGLDPDSGLVTLAYALNLAGCDEGQFSQLMENFLRVAQHWQERLAGGLSGPAPQSADAPGGPAEVDALRV